MTEDLYLDGNAIAGLLEELFGSDLTSAPRGCPSCGTVNPVGAHHLYRGAGIVLRCPRCGDLAARIVPQRHGHILQLTGTWRLDIRA